MNEVSIIINGVRYDAVRTFMPVSFCKYCDLYGTCDGTIDAICKSLNIPREMIFKKSDKKFEL